MIVLLLICAIIGLFVGGCTGYALIGLLAAAAVFVCGLPGVFITGCIYGPVEYAQDRADLREMEAEIAAEELAERHEFFEDARAERLNDAIGNIKPVVNDNRQVHIHN
jgi:hypothetical protein